jgi:hypothetical protein
MGVNPTCNIPVVLAEPAGIMGTGIADRRVPDMEGSASEMRMYVHRVVWSGCRNAFLSS